MADRKHGGRRNEAAAENGKQVGAPPKTATIRAGNPIRVLQSFPDGGVTELGKGVVEIVRNGQSRTILLPQEDGSVIRIWVF